MRYSTDYNVFDERMKILVMAVILTNNLASIIYEVIWIITTNNLL
jgi:hypothetical protein